ARLVGYLWPRQSDSSFSDCPALGPDGLEALVDDDGIVCLSPIRGEVAAVDRLRGLLAAAFGDEWSNAKERELLLEIAVANDTRKPAADLDDWLRQSFFAEHCKLFQSRPFVWQIWDGNPHGFSA
ncbi:MAG: SAM-dependent DNA methyltransferase, partial [bacterium]